MSNRELRQWAMDAARVAYAPYSGFKVGAALLAEDQNIYTGCNIENASYGATICAERVALLKMASQGVHRFSTIYIYSEMRCPPCGLCLQMMSEFATEDLVVTLGSLSGEEKSFVFSELLPLSFGPEYLSNKTKEVK